MGRLGEPPLPIYPILHVLFVPPPTTTASYFPPIHHPSARSWITIFRVVRAKSIEFRDIIHHHPPFPISPNIHHILMYFVCFKLCKYIKWRIYETKQRSSIDFSLDINHLQSHACHCQRKEKQSRLTCNSIYRSCSGCIKFNVEHSFHSVCELCVNGHWQLNLLANTRTQIEMAEWKSKSKITCTEPRGIMG